MLRVTVELIPHGIESQRETIGIVEIRNNGTGSKARGNYNYHIFKKGSTKTIWRTGAVWEFPRKRLLVWDLLYRVLKDAVGDRNEIAVVYHESDDEFPQNAENRMEVIK